MIDGLNNIEENDFVNIKDVDNLIKDYFKNSVIERGLVVSELRILCSIKPNKSYLVVSVCHPCKMLKILVDGMNVPIYFSQISEVHLMKLKPPPKLKRN